MVATQSASGGDWNCQEFETEKNVFVVPKPIVDDQVCTAECNVMNQIYDNCFVDKMKGMSKVVRPSVHRSCQRIACNPTFFQKLRYK